LFCCGKKKQSAESQVILDGSIYSPSNFEDLVGLDIRLILSRIDIFELFVPELEGVVLPEVWVVDDSDGCFVPTTISCSRSKFVRVSARFLAPASLKIPIMDVPIPSSCRISRSGREGALITTGGNSWAAVAAASAMTPDSEGKSVSSSSIGSDSEGGEFRFSPDAFKGACSGRMTSSP
jgi:hypothetical protein